MIKKQYIFPVVEEVYLNTRELMKAADASSEMPPGMGLAPKRWTEVF